MTTLDRVRSVVAAVLKVPEQNLTPQSSPDDIESWDSMHHLQIILALEEEFSVHFDADEIDGLQTVGALTMALGERLG
jgi:acyl carrier protein